MSHALDGESADASCLHVNRCTFGRQHRTKTMQREEAKRDRVGMAYERKGE